MDSQKLFNFKSDISNVELPTVLNDPFVTVIPTIAKIAVTEFQSFIAIESKKWDYDFNVQRGKMFGVLVVQQADNTYNYLGAISGKIPNNVQCENLVPSVFDVSTGDYFINIGMTELTEILNEIKSSSNPSVIALLKEKSRTKSIALQQRLFENYHFTNQSGVKKNLIEIFKVATQGNPPTAAGECAAPKLLQYAFDNKLKPIAMAEFWWGTSGGGEHGDFYPACKDRCRPILGFMLDMT